MLFEACGSFLKRTKRDWKEQKPYWSYEDIGLFSLILTALSAILDLLAHLHLLPRSERDHPGFVLQLTVIVLLILALYLILKLRYRQAVLGPLGWIWPPVAFVIIAPLLGGFSAAGVALCLHGDAHDPRTTPLTGFLVLGIVSGPVLEESFFRGCLLPVLACGLGTTSAVILTAFLFALFHGPASLLQWLLFSGTGTAYGWIRVTSRSTTAAALAHAAYNLVLILFAKS